MNGDAQPLAAPVTAAQAASTAQQTAQPAPMSNPGTSMPQAVQHATTQTMARQLGAYIPAGEQVAVQIKKGANAPMLQLNTKAHHEAVNEDLSHISSGGCFTSGRLGGAPAKRARV